MKKTYYFLCLLIAFGISVRTSAQTDPGLTNLTHQWTFDDGTAKDLVGTADGTLQGTATLANKALVTSAGGYMTFDGAAIGINTYAEATMEVWFTSIVGAGKDFSMLSYLGNTTGTVGTSYWSICPARNDAGNPSRTAISCLNTTSPWAAETGVNSTTYADAKLHHMVATLNATNITFYVDGNNVGTAELSPDNKLANVGTQFAYLAKGGYTGDPTWRGSIHKYSLYNKALSDAEVLFLFQKGAESQPVINTTTSSLVFDGNYPAESFSVSSLNLSSNITVTVPAGISLINSGGNPVTSIAANTADNIVTAIYDGTTVVDGNIKLTSGATVVQIHVKSASDATCFTPLYPGLTNLIESTGVYGGMATLTGFGGWGSKELLTVISDPTNVYCGAGSIKIGNGTSTGSGSLDVSMKGLLTPNTTYHVKVMIKTIGGTFHLGVDAAPNVEKAIDTNGEWKPLEFSFTTGAVLLEKPVMYINNWACTGLQAYVDNYELYVAPDPIINTSKSKLSFDADTKKTLFFTVTSSNLPSDITLAAPAGITLNKATLPAASASDTVVVTYDGTTAVNGNVTLTSGTTVLNVPVKALVSSSAACFTPMYTDRPNLNVDPYVNDITNFGGWGAQSINYDVDSVYCGSRCGLIAGSGSIDINLPGKLTPNSIYIAKAMIRTIGKFQMGIYGQGNTEFTDSINTHGAWQAVTFQFNTGATPSATAAGLYFNNWGLSGTRGYIDNWELYKKDTISAVANVREQYQSIFVQNGKIVADFDTDNASVAQLAVYNVQGALLSDEKFASAAGRNRVVLTATLPSGMYIVRLTQNGQNRYTKLIK
jgi:hypothetical protein